MRIVSLVPSLSELTDALGAGLVGVTRYCVRPPDLRDRPGVAVIGGTKNPDVEAILALRPDLVLANREENEREHVAALRRETEVLVTDVRTVTDAVSMVRRVGEAIGRAEAADVLVERIRVARDRRSGPAERPTFLALIWRKPFMAAGPDTYLSDLLTTVGGANVIGDAEPRYPTLETGAIRDLAPDFVVLPSEPYPFAEKHAAEIRRLGPEPVLADGELLTWYGVRTPDGLAHAGALLGT